MPNNTEAVSSIRSSIKSAVSRRMRYQSLPEVDSLAEAPIREKASNNTSRRDSTSLFKPPSRYDSCLEYTMPTSESTSRRQIIVDTVSKMRVRCFFYV